jgi:hypothetical protein
MRDKRRAIALVAEAPDRAGFGRLEVWQSNHGAGVDEIGHGVEPLDGQTGVTVHDHALGGRGVDRKRNARRRNKACQQANNGYSGVKTLWRATAVSFLPLCRHS